MKQPAYKIVAPIENQKSVESILKKLLKGSSITLLHEELLLTLPEIWNKLRDLLTSKQVANKHDTAILLNMHINPMLLSVKELIKNNEELSRGILRISNPFETYLLQLPPGAECLTLMVMKESHMLQFVEAVMDNKECVECVINPGLQIVSMSKAVCHTFELVYDLTIILNMQSMNGEVDLSLRLARNMPFQISKLTLYLQVHVIWQAAYNVLLGQPLNVLMASVIYNFCNEDQIFTLHCLNSKFMTTIPIFAREKPQFKMLGF
jgi:hypothetical protein